MAAINCPNYIICKNCGKYRITNYVTSLDSNQCCCRSYSRTPNEKCSKVKNQSQFIKEKVKSNLQRWQK